LRELGAFGTGVLGVMVVNYATRNIDNALIGLYLGPRALGYYALAYNLVLLPSSVVSSMFNRVSFPLLSSLRSDTSRLRAEYLRILRVLSAVSVPLVVGVCALAPVFVQVVYGPAWAPVAPILRIFVVIGVLESINTSGTVFYAMGRPRLLAAWALLSFVVMTVGFLVGVRFSLEGVVWAYVAVTPIVYAGPHLIAAKLIGLTAGRIVVNITPAIVAASAMAAVLFLLRDMCKLTTGRAWTDLAAYVGVGAAVYTTSIAAVITLSFRRGVLTWLREAT